MLIFFLVLVLKICAFFTYFIYLSVLGQYNPPPPIKTKVKTKRRHWTQKLHKIAEKLNDIILDICDRDIFRIYMTIG